MPAALDVGKSFLSDLLSKIPEDSRAAVAAAFSASDAAVETLGKGALAQSEFSRAMDAVKATEKALEAERAGIQSVHSKQQEWWKTVQPVVALGEAAQAAGWTPEAPPAGGTPPAAATLPEDVLRKADMDKLVESHLAVVAYVNKLSASHLHEFGEVLDLSPLIAEAQSSGKGLPDVYAAKFADRFAEKRQKALDAEVESRVQTRLADERKKFGHGVYPTGPSTGSPLDALAPPPNAAGDVSDLVAEYERLTQTA